MRLRSLMMFALFTPARLSTTHRAEIICLSQHASCPSSPAPLEFQPRANSGPTKLLPFRWMCLVLSIYFLSLQPPHPTYFHSSPGKLHLIILEHWTPISHTGSIPLSSAWLVAEKAPFAFSPQACSSSGSQPCANLSISPVSLWVPHQPAFCVLICFLQYPSHGRDSMSEWTTENRSVISCFI